MAERLDLRAALAAAPAVSVLAYAWRLLEEPASVGVFCVAAGLALVPAAARAWRRRLMLALATLVAVLPVAFTARPDHALELAWKALHDAPAVRAPFDPSSYAALHGLVVLAAFGVALAASLAAAARRPAVLALVTAIGVGFPAVLLEDAHSLRLGLLALGAVLSCALCLNVETISRATLATAVALAVMAASAGLAVAGLAPGAGRVDWRGWDPFAGGLRTADVRYVWDADYGGIDFPARPTVVLRVRAPKLARYWRVSTLETFSGDRWIENLVRIATGDARRRLPPDPLVPARDARSAFWLRQVVTIEGLEETRLAAAGQPARIDAPSLGRLSYLGGGVMRAGRPLRRGTRYTVWSYAPRPTPRALAASPARYPSAVGRYLALGGARFSGFGAQGREATVERELADAQQPQLGVYRPLWQEARRLTARARSPYEATLLLERWFRSEGGFRYEEDPPDTGEVPLVEFVQVTRAGYCQHYAGAMAVMLRMLGIPARVAVGFTSGTWKAGVWTVTDHQAHAWVEAWFSGFGWLAFDPTPGRGTLSAVYTLASDSAGAVAALRAGRFLDFTRAAPEPSAGRPVVAPAPEHSRGTPWWPLALVTTPLVAAGLLVGTKRLRSLWRLRTREPRLLARGVRAELIGALVDRGAAVAPDATTSELRQAAQRILSVPAGALLDALADARYGRPERAATAARQARRELRDVLSAAAAQEGRTDRLRIRLSHRSLRPGLTPSARS